MLRLEVRIQAGLAGAEMWVIDSPKGGAGIVGDDLPAPFGPLNARGCSDDLAIVDGADGLDVDDDLHAQGGLR